MCGPVSANALNHVCVRVCVCVCECMCVFVSVCGCLCMWAWECRCSYHWRKNFGRRCRPFLVSINISEHKRALTIIFARLSWRALRIARSMHTRRARSIHTASTQGEQEASTQHPHTQARTGCDTCGRTSTMSVTQVLGHFCRLLASCVLWHSLAPVVPCTRRA